MAGANSRNPLGWGFVESALGEPEVARLQKTFGGFFDLGKSERRRPPHLEQVALAKPRVAIAPGCAEFASATLADRVLHAAGRSYRDLVALRTNALTAAPDWVAYPRDQNELVMLLEAADRANLAVIPFGGGTSVVGGVNPEVPSGFAGVVSLDLSRLNRILAIDVRDRVVHAEAGILGPALDEALRPHGLATRHYPQSYYHASLGGWIAARGAGHFSTLHAKIEDRVQALKFISPSGLPFETRPLPASSVFLDPNRLAAGSEGALGVISEVRLRVVEVPKFKADASIEFTSFELALEVGRAIVQAGLWPTQLRILDPFERLVSALTAGQPPKMQALMLLSFESAHGAMDGRLDDALKICRAHGGQVVAPIAKASPEASAEAWKNSFFRQPYMRDALIDFGVIVDTFETAVPWSRIPDFYRQVREATLQALRQVCGGGGVLCRVTHAYLDGVALYFSLYGLGQHGRLIEQWWEIKKAAAEAVLQQGGTASHHHAMGRDHRPWAQRELPAGAQAAMRAVKQILDPRGIMNPGLCP